jgi:type 1 fimbria pilin
MFTLKEKYGDILPLCTYQKKRKTMKLNKYFVGASLSALSLNALSYDGLITFTGGVTSTTCSITTPNQTVYLPILSSASFNSSQTGGATNFSISFDCSNQYADYNPREKGYVTVFFEADPSRADLYGNIINTGTAQHLFVQIIGADGQQITPGQQISNTTGNQGSPSLGYYDSQNEVNYVAQYYTDAAISLTPGSYIGTVTYSLNYQ